MACKSFSDLFGNDRYVGPELPYRRFNLCRSAMQPGDHSLRNMWVAIQHRYFPYTERRISSIKEEMDELVKKFSDGYEGYIRDMLPGTG